MNDLWQDMVAQPQALRDHASRIAEAAHLVEDRVAPGNASVVLTGMATSLYAWESAGLLLQAQKVISPWIVDTAQLLDYGLSAARDDRPLFVLSRSGESAEISRLAELLPPDRMMIGITEASESPLGRRAQLLLCFEAGEKAFPNTKSFTLSLAYTLACACGLGVRLPVPAAQWVEEAATAVEELLERGEAGAARVAELLVAHRVVLLTGRGHLTGMVGQGVLDLQEGARLAAIPVPGGLFRHGTIELTTRADVVTLALIPGDHTAGLGSGLVNELAGRRAPVAAIAGGDVSIAGAVPVLRVPDVRPELLPIVYGVALQYVTFMAEKLLGISQVKPLLVGKVTEQE